MLKLKVIGKNIFSMENSKKRGLFIILEGLDRSGKSTQTENLRSFFINQKNERAELIKFPDRDITSGKMLDQYLTNKSTNIYC